MNAPLVGIALAAYKPNVEFFRVQLQSIVDQTYSNWVCIVGFDSPIDEVRNDVGLAPFFEDPRFEFVQNVSTRGVVGNFESTGLACLKRSPKYIAYSDQDDEWYPNKLARLVAALASCPPLSVVHCDMHVHVKQTDGSFVNLTQTAWQLERRGVHHVAPLDFLVRNVVAGAGLLMDADLVRQYPAIPADVFGQDHWYPLVASYRGEVRALHEPLYAYRIHGKNVFGVAQYNGFFAASKSSLQLGFVNKCIVAYNTSKARLACARAVQLPVTLTQTLIIGARFDLGVGYLLRALLVALTDPALARSCTARGIGKILKFFHPRESRVHVQ